MEMDSNKRVTIYDIAKIANVSTTTVSRVLSKSNYPVKKEVAQHIEKIAKELNYYPNSNARNLKNRNSKNIGVLIPSFINPFYTYILKAMEDAAFEKGYTLFISSVDEEKQRGEKYIQLFIENNVCGIITVFTDTETDNMDNYIDCGGKVVSLVSTPMHNPSCANFYFDRKLEMKMMMCYLLELGHKDIAFLTYHIKENDPIRVLRRDGYIESLRDAGIDKSYIYESDDLKGKEYVLSSVQKETTSRLVGRVLRESPGVTAIVCLNDMIALSVITYLSGLGYKVPQDFSVAGFDDLFFSSIVEPRITTVKFEKLLMGQLAMEAIIDIVEKKADVKTCDMTEHFSLRIRTSTAVPRPR